VSARTLAAARDAATAILKQDTGKPRPMWRVVITDSESPTGLAPVCTGESSDALHMIDDYPGGPTRDEDGVYDCCPWPQIETNSTAMAAYLVELLNADTREEATAPAATATPQGGDPLTIRWDREVWHAESDTDDTIVCCLTDDGQPVALLLDDEHREALGLILIDPTGESESTPDFFQPGHTYTREHHGHRIEFLVEHVATTPSGSHQVAFGWKTGFGWPEEPFDSDDLDGWADSLNTRKDGRS
jgi:hypothetical protein